MSNQSDRKADGYNSSLKFALQFRKEEELSRELFLEEASYFFGIDLKPEMRWWDEKKYPFLLVENAEIIYADGLLSADLGIGGNTARTLNNIKRHDILVKKEEQAREEFLQAQALRKKTSSIQEGTFHSMKDQL